MSGENRPPGDAAGLVERVAALERTVRRHAKRLDAAESPRVGRRSVLGAVGAAGLLTLGANRAAARSSATRSSRTCSGPG